MSHVAALERIVAARRAIHDEVCIQQDRFPCLGCPPVQAIAQGLDALDVKANNVRLVRLAFHRAVCASGCTGESADDHAKRTQTKAAAALRRFHRSERAA